MTRVLCVPSLLPTLFLLLASLTPAVLAQSDASSVIEQGRPPSWHIGQHRKLASALGGLKPQRPGIVDAYVLSIGLDSDPVFGREAAEAARVLSRRYDAEGRTVLLSAGTGAKSVSAPNGSPQNLAVMLAGIAERMDPKEDVLILFATAHGGADNGLAYRDDGFGSGMVGPKRMADMLDGLGVRRRMVIVSACYSGIFVEPLANDHSVIVTAASATTTSFGCLATNDWTYFGDALINTALRKPVALDAAVKEAFDLIAGWEAKDTLFPSQPQVSVGAKAKAWLDPLESRMPKTASAKTGKPSAAP